MSVTRVRSAVVLAGGLGTRLRSAVPDLPKPMAPVNGRPFLEHQLDYWIEQGIECFVLSVGYLRERIIAHFGNSYRGAAIEYAVEEQPRGTGGGLLLAVSRLNDDEACLVLNGDTYFEVDLPSLQAFHDARRADWTVALFRSTEPGRYMGLDVAEDGRVLSLNTGKDGVGALVNGGVYLVQPGCLRNLGVNSGDTVSLEREILPSVLTVCGTVYGTAFSGSFIDIGVPDDYFRASSLLN